MVRQTIVKILALYQHFMYKYKPKLLLDLEFDVACTLLRLAIEEKRREINE